MSSKTIIATIGPASFAPSIVKKMDEEGVDIFRINLSHTAVEDVETVYTMISSWTDKPVCPDTQGVQHRNNPRLFGFGVGRLARWGALSDKDKEMLKILNRLGASTVFLSFCSWPEDVEELKKHFDYPITVVSKIENKEGLHNLKEICAVSDGILVDREDLSKDVPLVRIPYAQDYIVARSAALVLVSMPTTVLPPDTITSIFPHEFQPSTGLPIGLNSGDEYSASTSSMSMRSIDGE